MTSWGFGQGSRQTRIHEGRAVSKGRGGFRRAGSTYTEIVYSAAQRTAALRRTSGPLSRIGVKTGVFLKEKKETYPDSANNLPDKLALQSPLLSDRRKLQGSGSGTGQIGEEDRAQISLSGAGQNRYDRFPGIFFFVCQLKCRIGRCS